MLKSLFLGSIFLCSLCYAKFENQSSDKYLEYKSAKTILGTITEFVGDIQIDDKGTMNTFDFRPIFGIGIDFNTQYDFEFNTEFLVSYPEEMGDASGVSKQLFLIRADIQKKYFTHWYFKIGTSWFITNIYGNGGTQSLGNGAGSTAFPKSSKSNFSHNFTLDLSAEYMINKEWGVKLHTLYYNLHDTEQFAWSYIITANYYWDIKTFFK